ncbi:hypothetical protein [Agrobacterium pusense]
MLKEAYATAFQIDGEVIPPDLPASLAMAVWVPSGVNVGIAPWNPRVILVALADAAPLARGKYYCFSKVGVVPRPRPSQRGNGRRWTASYGCPAARRGGQGVGRVTRHRSHARPEEWYESWDSILLAIYGLQQRLNSALGISKELHEALAGALDMIPHRRLGPF